MNYLKHYCNLIRKAENRTLPEGYTEKHHIFPISIFGKNKRVVALTAREHYIAHVLLEKVYIKRYGLKDHRTIKMTYAHSIMKGNGGYVNSYLYECARIRFSETKKGKNHPMFGKFHSEETKAKISETKRGKTAWNKGKKNIFNEVSLQKISAFHKGKIIPEETRARMSASHKGKIISEETRAKLSVANRGKNLKLRYYITPQGEPITIKNLREYCEENNLNYHCMCNLHNGYSNSYKGYQTPPPREKNKPFEFE